MERAYSGRVSWRLEPYTQLLLAVELFRTACSGAHSCILCLAAGTGCPVRPDPRRRPRKRCRTAKPAKKANKRAINSRCLGSAWGKFSHELIRIDKRGVNWVSIVVSKSENNNFEAMKSSLEPIWCHRNYFPELSSHTASSPDTNNQNSSKTLCASFLRSELLTRKAVCAWVWWRVRHPWMRNFPPRVSNENILI